MYVKANVRNRYDEYRNQAREISSKALPGYLKRLRMEGIDNKAIIASKMWIKNPDRKVDWDWSESKVYCSKYPKAFDLSIWNGNTLISLSLGRPTYKGASMRLDFVERTPNTDIFSGQMFTITRLAYETYGRLVGADFIRVMEPMNQKLIQHYTSSDKGFSLVSAKRGVPHYLVKKL